MSAEDSELAKAIVEFTGAFEVVFGEDWEYTRYMLDDSRDRFVPPGTTFINPTGVPLDQCNWGARAALLRAYQRLLTAMASHDLKPSLPVPGKYYTYEWPKASLGFTDTWFTLGVLTQEELREFETEFETSSDKNPEHYRYRAFRGFLQRNRPLSPARCDALYELGDSDPDITMGGSMMADILRLPECPPEVIEKARVSPRKYLVKIAERRSPRTTPPDT